MAAEYIDTFIRYSDRTAEGGFIRANGDYSFGMEDHPARVRNARLESIEFGTHGFTLLRHATDVDFANPDDVKGRYHPEACRLALKALELALHLFQLLLGCQQQFLGLACAARAAQPQRGKHQREQRRQPSQ